MILGCKNYIRKDTQKSGSSYLLSCAVSQQCVGDHDLPHLPL